jgi:hypothetical protein
MAVGEAGRTELAASANERGLVLLASAVRLRGFRTAWRYSAAHTPAPSPARALREPVLEAGPGPTTQPGVPDHRPAMVFLVLNLREAPKLTDAVLSA